ncbi:fimbria/pilus outer membrane usher protein [Edwardsiella piscicida]|nr:fimbria/pilus outer membrane usher protein [Edwardsiella piscicida]
MLDTYRHGDGWYFQDYRVPEYGYRPYWYRDDTNDKRKTRISITLSQPLGEWGSLSFSGSRENYWNRSQHQDDVSARYSGPMINGISWSMDWTQCQLVYRSYSRGTNAERKTDNSVSLWVSIPLDRWLGGGTNVTYQMQNGSGQSTQYPE